MRRSLVLAGAAVTVFGLLAGCSAGGGGSDSGRTTLKVAALVPRRPAGLGAVREVCEHILASRGP